MGNLLIRLVIFLFLLVLAGVVPAAKKSIDAAVLYLEQCAVCHGDKGSAGTRIRSGMNPPPRDFSSAETAMELTRERMIDSVTNGRPGTAMVAHKGRLSNAEIVAIVDYIRANFMRTPMAEAVTSEAVDVGEKIYVKNCSACHGDTGKTAVWARNGLNPPPRDFTSPEALGMLSRKRMIDAVTDGRPGTGMMPFKKRLSDEEIAEVVKFIRFKFMGVDPKQDSGETPLAQLTPEAAPHRPAPAVNVPAGEIPSVDAPLAVVRPDPHQLPHDQASQAMPATPGMPQGHSIDADMSLPIPNNFKGDVLWGREFYMKNCFACHGVKGDGNGPRAYFNTPRPRDFTSEASRRILNRPRLHAGITNGRVGTVMPAWGKVLTEQQIANLTEYVFQTFIQSSTEEITAVKERSVKKKKTD
jgi:mono/diheme cytochrome c family protein